MSEAKSLPDNRGRAFPSVGWLLAIVLGAGLLALVVLTALLAANTPVGAVLGRSLNQLFAIDSVQLMWYITRSAGLVAYLLLWFSTAWGLAVTSKILDAVLHRTFTYDFHQFISLLSIGFIALHVAVLMADRYLPYSLAQVLVPFLSPYRPVWIGIGVIAFYLCLLVTITFYMRNRIGMHAFRWIHVSSMAAYLGAIVHSFLAGTDSSLPAAQWMYASTFLVVVFLTAYWLIMAREKRREQARRQVAALPGPISQPVDASLGLRTAARARPGVRIPYSRHGASSQGAGNAHNSRSRPRH
jgi:predicted ferric reductase